MDVNLDYLVCDWRNEDIVFVSTTRSWPYLNIYIYNIYGRAL
jgi:hypothetical protein